MNTQKAVKMAALLLGTTISLSACTNNDAARLQTVTDENAKLKAEVQQLQESLKEARAVQATAPVAPVPNVVPAVAITETVATESATPTAFADIAGVFGEKEIRDLAKIEVLAATPDFHPTKPISRAEFVSWLVATNNKIRQADYIRLAEADEQPIFKDVPSTHPLFKYIQGMANAGWSIGYKDGTFRPDKALTREEMIAIKALFDKPFVPSSDYAPEYTDRDKISADFYHAWCVEKWNNLNFARIYGSAKVCHPQNPVTRAEAAVCVSQIGYQPQVSVATAAQKI